MSVSSRGNTAVAVDAEGKGFLISAGGLVALNGRIAPHGCPLPDGTILLGTVERYPKLNNITLPGGEVKSYITPSTLRPSSRNKTLAVFARTGNPQECIQIDELTDLGMTGPQNSILGIRPELSIQKFRGDLTERYKWAGGPTKLEAVLFTIDTNTGLCKKAERVDLRDENSSQR